MTEMQQKGAYHAEKKILGQASGLIFAFQICGSLRLEIKARCRKSQMVVPFDEELLNPASLDLRLGDYLMVESIYS